MTAVTPKKKAAVKRSPRAAKPVPAADPAAPTDEELEALAAGQADEELDDGEIRPVIIGKRGRRGNAPVEMVTLFELNDVPYQIPRNPSAGLVLSWLFDQQKSGPGLANLAMGVQLLGEETMAALRSSPEVEAEDLVLILTNIGKVFFNSENYNQLTATPDPS